MSRVAVIGVGQGRFGRRGDATVQELAYEAFRQAVQQAGIARSDIDALVVGSVPGYQNQRSLAGAIHTYLNLMPAPVWLSEAACASGGAAIRTAWMAIRSGVHQLVAVVGCQKMTELTTSEVQALMGKVGDVQWEACFGTTFPGYYALFARRHMHDFGTTREQLAAISVKNHYYGARNPNAMFRKEVSVEQVLESPLVASPLRLYDCSANADGAACVLLASDEMARSLRPTGPRVYLDGCGAASAPMSVLVAGELNGVPSTREAARQAYQQAGVGPQGVRVAQVHDGFTITELMAYEDLGFCHRGEGGAFAEGKETWLGGSIPVNVDGGIKARGHPIGASGVAMAVEIVRQLRGECGDRQVHHADVGLMQNVGGIGQYVFVNVFRRDA